MMEGSSLRMMVGMYSALGTLEEMSWGQHTELLREGPAASGRGAAGAPVRRTPKPCSGDTPQAAPRGAQ